MRAFGQDGVHVVCSWRLIRCTCSGRGWLTRAPDGPKGHGEAVVRKGWCPVEDRDGLEHRHESQHDLSESLGFVVIGEWEMVQKIR